MLRQLLAFLAALPLTSALAALEVNQASEAELDGIKGLGPATSRLIIAERSKAEFRNWADFLSRIKGLGDKSAAKFSAQGMTVGGAAYEPGMSDANAARK